MLIGNSVFTSITNAVTELKNSMGITDSTVHDTVGSVHVVDVTGKLSNFMSLVNERYPNIDTYDIRTMYMIVTEVIVSNSAPANLHKYSHYADALMDIIYDEFRARVDNGDLDDFPVTTDMVTMLYSAIVEHPSYGNITITHDSMTKVIPLRWILSSTNAQLHLGVI